jgi:hypothetical protein
MFPLHHGVKRQSSDVKEQKLCATLVKYTPMQFGVTVPADHTTLFNFSCDTLPRKTVAIRCANTEFFLFTLVVKIKSRRMAFPAHAGMVAFILCDFPAYLIPSLVRPINHFLPIGEIVFTSVFPLFSRIFCHNRTPFLLWQKPDLRTCILF